MDFGKYVKEALETELIKKAVKNRIYRFNNTSGEYPAITWFLYGVNGELYGDGEEVITRGGVQVDIWTKGSFSNIADVVYCSMKSNGFLRSDEQEFYEEDTKIYHKVFRFNLYARMESEEIVR